MKKEVGEDGGKNGKGMAPAAPQRDSTCWVLCLEGSLSLLQVGILGEVSGKGCSRIFISSPGVLSQGHGLHLLVSSRAGGL